MSVFCYSVSFDLERIMEEERNASSPQGEGQTTGAVPKPNSDTGEQQQQQHQREGDLPSSTADATNPNQNADQCKGTFQRHHNFHLRSLL